MTPKRDASPRASGITPIVVQRKLRSHAVTDMPQLLLHHRMLIRPKLLTRYWGLCPETIVHVGGHEAEELREY